MLVATIEFSDKWDKHIFLITMKKAIDLLAFLALWFLNGGTKKFCNHIY
jgi:hypothetical protein